MIITLTIGLSLALLLGISAQKLKLSPLVGYLVAGMLAGALFVTTEPGGNTLWGIAVDTATVNEFSHIGVVLLLFGVGLQFHFKDLLAVQKIALPGAIVCMLARAALGAVFYYWLTDDATWVASLLFGACMCVSSTVVLTRVLADNKTLSTPSGHVALGWLVVEDIFTIILLVLIPVFFEGKSIGPALGWLAVKLTLLVLCVAFLGKKLIEKTLTYVARSTSDELFTLSVLVIALGIAVLSSTAFDISLEFGAFLSGMVVGQSKFSARAASDALPMRDAFAVLFFVSVGMEFRGGELIDHWQLALSAVLLTLLAKPLVAYIVIRLLRRPNRMAFMVSASLSQVGEFSFILASLIAGVYGLLPDYAVNVITGTAIITITLNAALYRYVPRLANFFEDRGIGVKQGDVSLPEPAEDVHRVIMVGYGPCGEILTGILSGYHVEVVVIEMNVDTVTRLTRKGINALHGDARQRTILKLAGVEKARAIIITSFAAPTAEITAAARSISPDIAVMAYTAYHQTAFALRRGMLRKDDQSLFFSGEEEVALAMTSTLLNYFGATKEQIARECDHARASFARRAILGQKKKHKSRAH